MAKKDTQRKKASRDRTEAEGTEHRAPSGRGGVAMGRTVGLPFGGARPRKRRDASTTTGKSKTK